MFHKVITQNKSVIQNKLSIEQLKLSTCFLSTLIWSKFLCTILKHNKSTADTKSVGQVLQNYAILIQTDSLLQNKSKSKTKYVG